MCVGPPAPDIYEVELIYQTKLFTNRGYDFGRIVSSWELTASMQHCCGRTAMCTHADPTLHRWQDRLHASEDMNNTLNNMLNADMHNTLNNTRAGGTRIAMKNLGALLGGGWGGGGHQENTNHGSGNPGSGASQGNTNVTGDLPEPPILPPTPNQQHMLFLMTPTHPQAPPTRKKCSSRSPSFSKHPKMKPAGLILGKFE